MAKNKFPQKFYTIKYENLVNNPKTELEKMCSFLQIEFKDQMLYAEEYIEKFKSTYQIDGFEKYHSGMLKQVNNSKVEVWKKEMPEEEIKIADMVIGKWANRYGYELKYNKVKPLLYLYMLPIYAHFSLQWFIGLFVKLLPNKTGHDPDLVCVKRFAM